MTMQFLGGVLIGGGGVFALALGVLLLGLAGLAGWMSNGSH